MHVRRAHSTSLVRPLRGGTRRALTLTGSIKGVGAESRSFNHTEVMWRSAWMRPAFIAALKIFELVCLQTLRKANYSKLAAK